MIHRVQDRNAQTLYTPVKPISWSLLFRSSQRSTSCFPKKTNGVNKNILETTPTTLNKEKRMKTQFQKYCKTLPSYWNKHRNKDQIVTQKFLNHSIIMQAYARHSNNLSVGCKAVILRSLSIQQGTRSQELTPADLLLNWHCQSRPTAHMKEAKIPAWQEHRGNRPSENTNPLDFLELQLTCKHMISGDQRPSSCRSFLLQVFHCITCEGM